MKKIAAFFLLTLLICLIPLSALANGTTVQIAELGMSITFPERFIILNRDIDEADENLALLGTTAEALEEHLINNNIYLDALNVDPLYEYVVTKTTHTGLEDVADFSDYTDEELTEFADYIMDAAEEIEIAKEAGLTFSGYEIARIGSYTYIIAPGSHTFQGQLVYTNQYSTIYNGQAINITLQSYTGEVTPEMKAEQRAIVESITLPAKTISAQKGSIDWNEVFRAGLIGMIAGAIIAIPSAIIKNIRKKKQGTYQYEGAPIPEKRLMSLLPTAYCRKCGAKLLEFDQEYCSTCGSREYSGE